MSDPERVPGGTPGAGQSPLSVCSCAVPDAVLCAATAACLGLPCPNPIISVGNVLPTAAVFQQLLLQEEYAPCGFNECLHYVEIPHSVCSCAGGHQARQADME